MSDLRDIPLNAIALSPHNPRRINRDDPAIAELAQSIEGCGLLQPVVCRPRPGGEFELLAGARRFHAHMHLGRESILAIVRDLDDRQAIEVTVLENLQRQNLTPMEEARGVKELLDAGADMKRVADEIGRSLQWVARRKALCGLSPKWVALLEDGKTSIGHAELAAGYPTDFQERMQDEFRWMMAPNQLREFRAQLAMKSMKLSSAPWDLDDMTLCTRGPFKGACSACTARSGKQPELWAENGVLPEKNDRCLNPACWREKAAAWEQRAEAEARAKYPDLIRVQTEYNEAGNDEKALREYQFDKVAKPGKGVVHALVTYGPGLGKVILVKPKNVSDRAVSKQQNGGKVPLKERQEQLANRRRAWVIKHVAEALTHSTLDRADVVSPVAGKPSLLLALAATFGTDERVPHPGVKLWEAAENAHKDEAGTIKKLWAMVAGVLQDRMRLWGGDCTRQYEEALEIAELLDMPGKAKLDEIAAKALPEPKAWAAEIAAEKEAAWRKSHPAKAAKPKRRRKPQDQDK